ncbi:MAG: hypothetical protein ACLUFV_02705 [Acutalibacteraceae bacterium]
MLKEREESENGRSALRPFFVLSKSAEDFLTVLAEHFAYTKMLFEKSFAFAFPRRCIRFAANLSPLNPAAFTACILGAYGNPESLGVLFLYAVLFAPAGISSPKEGFIDKRTSDRKAGRFFVCTEICA